MKKHVFLLVFIFLSVACSAQMFVGGAFGNDIFPNLSRSGVGRTQLFSAQVGYALHFPNIENLHIDFVPLQLNMLRSGEAGGRSVASWSAVVMFRYYPKSPFGSRTKK